MAEASQPAQGDSGNLKTVCWAVYWMYVAAIVANFLGLSFIGMVLSVIALIVAIVYRNRDEGGIYRSHFMNQIVVSVVGIVVALLFIVLVGAMFSGGNLQGAMGGMMIFMLIAIAVGIWSLIRIVRGMLLLNGGDPYPRDGKGFI